MKNFISLLGLLFLASCAQPDGDSPSSQQTKDSIASSSNASSPNPAQADNKSQNKVILLDSLYTAYVDEVARGANKDNAYTRKVSVPIFAGLQNAEFIDLIRNEFSVPVQDTTTLRKKITLLRANLDQIKNRVYSALAKCDSALPNTGSIFYIIPASTVRNNLLARMGGVTGSTAGGKHTFLVVDPDVPTWSEHLEYATAHEYNHQYWVRNCYSPNFEWSMLEYLFFEGKADSFAHLLYPKVKVAWTSALTETGKIELWARIKPGLNKHDMRLLGEVMFGSQNYPLWGGYTLGFDLVQTALKNNPELEKQNWTKMDAAKLTGFSNYK